jgi:CubicO group peptidase (beta-lactamase class C family)
VPAERQITVRDLFRHTTGLDYAGPKEEDGKNAYSKLGIDSGAPQVDFDLKELVKRLATAPLNDQPGTTFRYGFSTDVLGRLVEVVSGKPLDQFFEERIFKPLGMKDSGFFVPEEKWSRLATLYAPKRGADRNARPSPHRTASRRSLGCSWAARDRLVHSTTTLASAQCWPTTGS